MKKPISKIIGKITRRILKIYALFAQKQLFIDSQRNTFLLIEHGGFSFCSFEEEIFFPWSSVLSFQNRQSFSIDLKNNVAGKDYYLKRVAKIGRDLFEDPFFSLEGKRAIFDAQQLVVSKAWIQALENGKEAFDKEFSSVTALDGKAELIDLQYSSFPEGIVAIKKNIAIEYPSYCPFSESDCDTMRCFVLEGGYRLRWAVSRFYWIRDWIWKVAIFSLPTLSFVFGNYFFLWGELLSREFIFQQAILAFCSLLLHAVLVFNYQINFSIFQKSEYPELVFVQIKKRDYLFSFLALNRVSPFDL